MRLENKKRKELFSKISVRKLKKDQILILLLTGVLLVVIALPSGGTKETTGGERDSDQTEMPVQDSQTGYTQYLEQKLSDTLSQIEGAGEVTVMVTLKSSAEKVVEKDQTSDQETVTESDSQGGTRTTKQENQEESTVYAQGDGQDQSPYVSKELSPQIEGVVVVAQGGDQAVVKQNITEAVEALFGIESHKIRIMKKHES
nr:stage III sporulation protein AG [uncultured Merdimonas sp.]